MLAVEVNFLTGRFVATAYNDRKASEWPPEPARLFSALVAEWAEAGEEDGEREALEWLEAQPPPAIVASEAVPRRVVSYYVPVNDSRVIGGAWYERRSRNLSDLEYKLDSELKRSDGELTKKVKQIQDKIKKESNVDNQVSSTGTTAVESALELLPYGRVKQERCFPSVTPNEPRITFIWLDATISEPMRASFDSLLEKVTRLGHSSSLVSCRIIDNPPTPNWHPGSGSQVLRCPGPGQLEALIKRFQYHQAIKPRSLPFSAVRYNKNDNDSEFSDPLLSDTMGDWVVFEFLLQSRSRRFPSSRSVEIASTMRAAVMSYAEDPIPEGLSGHQMSGAPSLEPHVAFLPLPYVGFEHSDGRIMGLAVSLPISLNDASRRAVLRAIGHWEQQADPVDGLTLTLGRGGIIHLQRRVGPVDLITIRQDLWQKSSRHWASATPIALPTHPGPLSKGSAGARSRAWERAEQAVIASCRHVGLPEPNQVEISLDPFVLGARPAADFPPFRQRGQDGKPVARRLLHASLTFDQKVEGPLMLGAGRFMGLGLMRPIIGLAPISHKVDDNE
ncbi:type I-U CRISPR-associated protein Csb2 [Candidatus Poriferisocius sp.]|uniref:type I-G CRISPR-associated protein Csb2 n=1 Tax=Candidatus Poriferisocius sp. TaxID=3101276 RepID=UPI003B0265D5